MSAKNMEMMKKFLEKKKEQPEPTRNFKPERGKSVNSTTKKNQKPGGSNNKV